MGKGTFFNYFPSKEHALVGFGEIRVSKVQAALAEAGRGAGPVRAMLRRLAQVAAEGQRRGEIRRDIKPAEFVRHFQQTFFGALLLWALYPSSQLQGRLDTTLELFWSGVAAPPGQGADSTETQQ